MAKCGPKGPSRWTKEAIEAEAEALLVYAQESLRPLEKEFTSRRGYSSQRLSEFEKKNTRFSESFAQFKDIQYSKWIDLGLESKNPAFVSLILKNISKDIRDTQYHEGDGLKQIIIFGSTPKAPDANTRIGQTAHNA